MRQRVREETVVAHHESLPPEPDLRKRGEDEQREQCGETSGGKPIREQTPVRLDRWGLTGGFRRLHGTEISCAWKATEAVTEEMPVACCVKWLREQL